MKIVLVVALVAWIGGGRAEKEKDISQRQNFLHEKPTAHPHKSEVLPKKVQSEVKSGRQSRKINAGFFTSSMTKPLFSAMKSTLKLFQNPFKRKLKMKVSQKSPTKTTQRAKTDIQNVSMRQELRGKKPPKRVPAQPKQKASLQSKYPTRKSAPTQTKALKLKPPHQKHPSVKLFKSKTRKPNNKNEVKKHRPLNQKVSTKQTRKPQQVKSSNLRKHQQLISNFFRKPHKAHPNNVRNPQTLPNKPSIRSKSKYVYQQQQLNSNTRGNPQHEKSNVVRNQNEIRSTNIKTPQVLSNNPVHTSKRDQHPFEKTTIKRKVKTEEQKLFFPTNIKPIQPFNAKETNKTAVKQLIVELHDQIHDVLKHQNIPEQNKSFQTLPPVINIENTNFDSSDVKIRKPDVNPMVQNTNNNHARTKFNSAKLEDAFKDIKDFMKKDREIPNTQTSFSDNQKLKDTQNTLKQVPIKPNKFKPFIPRFKTIENQSPVNNDIPSSINTQITASTEEQELFKNKNKASVKTSSPVQANDNLIRFNNLIFTDPPKTPSFVQVAQKKQFEEAASSDVQQSKVQVNNGDIHTNALSKAFNRDLDTVPSSMDDCDHLVSDCYEKLLDRKIIELQNQMQMLELKYWGNRV